jgi:hypothetical protein
VKTTAKLSLILFFVLITSKIWGSSSLSLDVTQDYQGIIGTDASRQINASLGSEVTPAYGATFTTNLTNRLGLRLKFKHQVTKYYSPDDIDIETEAFSLLSYGLEIPYQHNFNLQSWVRYQKRDRLLFNIDEDEKLQLYKFQFDEFSYGINLETVNRPGFRLGGGFFTSYIQTKPRSDPDMDPNPGFEYGISGKIGYLTTGGKGLFFRAQYSEARIRSEKMDFLLKELIIGVGWVWQFGKV